MRAGLLFLIFILGLPTYEAPRGPNVSRQKGLPVLARYQFDLDAKDATGRNPDCQLKNATFSDNALYLNGRYQFSEDPQGYRVICSTPSLSYASFTVAVRFRAEKFDSGRSNIIAGGRHTGG